MNRSFLIPILALCQLMAHAEKSVTDSLPPAFRSDSAQTAAIRAVEAGKAALDSRAGARTGTGHTDSLDKKLHSRRPFLGATLSFAFGDLSAKQLFANRMNALSAQDSSRTLQTLDPVAIFFPVGLTAGFPLFPYLDFWLRTESFWYKQSGLSQGLGTGAATRQYWYAVQGDFAGIGVRYLIPVSLLSENTHSGLSAAYTRFWNFGPTGMYTTDGSVRAKTEPAGAGYEILAGFQQDFAKRWTWTGGLAYSSFTLKSEKSWRALIPDALDEPATWSLRSLRLCLQGFYQFGTGAAR